MVQFEGLWYEFIAGLQKLSFELQTSLIHQDLGVVSNSSGTAYVGRIFARVAHIAKVVKILAPQAFSSCFG